MSQILLLEAPKNNNVGQPPKDLLRVVYSKDQAGYDNWLKKLQEYRATQQKKQQFESVQYSLTAMLLVGIAFLGFESLGYATIGGFSVTAMLLVTLLGAIFLAPVLTIKKGLKERQFMFSRIFFSHGLCIEETNDGICLIRNADHEIVARTA
ncbi:hypothetical protein P2G88_15480 [Aliiglaciecola sp. CAU 1673]|uniref:hypothetical protein n=1 Tax=Aliiglaciecola sp. CAU 1673 TaxID=3032595 RepID=UPI0023DB0462|nr:hypothetical protein [Aliiglaciecola sp. CAU 1673]MDF2179651.1 hypothetical protein [Aliiglaciecola sp. CAU 1673]